MRYITTAILLALSMPALADDATSYAEAEAGGFTISGTNAIAAKVSAAILPVDGSTWSDVVNTVDGTLLGSASIAQEGSIGGLADGARYTDFDGSDDVVDMDQSYSTGGGAPVPNLATEAGPASGFVMLDHPEAVFNGTFFAERDGGTAVYAFFNSSDTNNPLTLRRGGTESVIDGGPPSANLTLYGFSLVDADTLTGYVDGTEASTVNPGAPNNATINLAIGARWGGYPTPGFLFTGKIYLVYLFDTNLSDAEHASLAANPWQIFDDTAQAAWNSQPSVTNTTTDTFTVAFETDIDATVYGVACVKDSAAPTGEQIVAGDCTGDVDAKGACTEATTGGVGDSCDVTVTDDPPFPIYDLHFIGCPEPGVC